MINLDSVTKVFEQTTKTGWFRKTKEYRTAVDNLSLQIAPGEIVGLLGLNGAGKTTTIKMMSTLLRPTSGEIRVDGLDVERHRRQIQAKVNMIAGGERMIYWRLTGRENLTYFGRLYGLSEAQVRTRSEALLKEVGLNEAADTAVEKYSKGMKQRLQIARGLINDPDYLFLDEPTLGLDAPIARHLRKVVKNLAQEQGKGILLTTHYLQEVEELCDRVYVIDRGRLLLTDTPTAVVQRVAGLEAVTFDLDGWTKDLQSLFVNDMRVPVGAFSVDGDETKDTVQVSVKTAHADIFLATSLAWFANHGVHVHAMNVQKPTLEDAIVRLAEGGHSHELLASVSS